MTQALKYEGFGILTEVDVSSTLKKKLEGGVEVAAIDPVASMQAIDNPNLKKVAELVRGLLVRAIDSL